MSVSRITKGRIGELIAAAAIEACGWVTVLTPMEYIDILAIKDGMFMRVQVKASMLGGKTPVYRFMTSTNKRENLSSDHIDVLAIVALDLRKVIFTNVSDLKKGLRVSPHHFDGVDVEKTSWKNAVNSVLGI